MRLLDLFYEGVAPVPSKRAEEANRSRPGSFRSQLLVAFCLALFVIGWGLLLATLLYVVSDHSMTTWLLTALGLAVCHVLLALACWHCAGTVWRDSSRDTQYQTSNKIRSAPRHRADS